MDSITIGQIFEWAVWLSGGIGAMFALYKPLKEGFHKALKSELDPIKQKLDELEQRMDIANRERAKNFVIRFLADMEQGEPIDQDELHCFWDNYQIYQSLGGNTYVHDKVEKLRKVGKL